MVGSNDSVSIPEAPGHDAVWDGQRWSSRDGRWWWDGARWQASSPPVSPRPWWRRARWLFWVAAALGALAVGALIAAQFDYLLTYSAIPTALLYAALAVSLLVLATTTAGAIWQRAYPFVALGVPVVWFLSYAVSVVAVCPGCTWAQGAWTHAKATCTPQAACSATLDSIHFDAWPQVVAVDAGEVWFTDDKSGSLFVLERGASHLSLPITIGKGAVGLALDATDAWVGDYEGTTVVRVNRATKRVDQRIQVGARPFMLAEGFGAIWVSSLGSGAVTRIDQASLAVSTIDLSARHLEGIAADSTAVWVAGIDSKGAGALWKIDPLSAAFSALPLGAQPNFVTAGAGSIWVTDMDQGVLYRVSPSPAIVAAIPVGHAPSGIAIGRASAWVANADDGTVSRIDLGSNRESATFALYRGPLDVVVDGSAVWVTSYERLTRLDQLDQLP